MHIITSFQNDAIKQVCNLHTAKYRKKYQQFIAEGIRTCHTLCSAGLKPVAVYVTQKMIEAAAKIAEQENIIVVSDSIMRKISTATTPSGLVCVFPIQPQPNPAALTKGLVLAQVADPGNMGTLIRSCAAMKINSVIIVDGADPWSPKVVQSSAGTIAMVTLFQWSWDELMQYKQQYLLCALVTHGGQHPEKITQNDVLLVVGSEAHGIPVDWLESCDKRVTIPMPGNTESLNAAVAGSIALYVVFANI